MEETNNTTVIEVTIEDILTTFKSSKEMKRVKDIKDAIVLLKYPEALLISEEELNSLHKQVEQLIKDDKSLGNESYLKYKDGKYSKRPNRKIIDPKQHPQQTGYIGTAGECAVISELLFAGYNANRMMLDEGVDIIATKNNIYYYVQVKTTFINDGKIYIKINSDRFFQQQNIHYIIVARYFKDDAWRNMYFSFTATELQSYMYNGCIKKGVDNISIKIKFHPRSGEPYLFNDNNEFQCAFHWNREDLLQPKPIINND